MLFTHEQIPIAKADPIEFIRQHNEFFFMSKTLIQIAKINHNTFLSCIANENRNVFRI